MQPIEEKIIGHGFVQPIIGADHYVLGASSIPQENLQPDRDWTRFLPEFEYQMLYGLETDNCSGFGTNNAWEILYKRKFTLTINFSDRDLGIKAGTRPPGNDPHTVAEAHRKQGVAKEDTLPWTTDANTIDKYYSYPSLAKKAQCVAEGNKLIEAYQENHEWLWTDPNLPIEQKQKLIMDALQYSPVAVSVLAWRKQGDLYVKDKGEPDNHWTVIVKGTDGQPWRLLDQYDPFIKDLAWDYDFQFAKRYHVEKTELIIQTQSKLILALKQLLALLQLKIASFGSKDSQSTWKTLVGRLLNYLQSLLEKDKAIIVQLPPVPLQTAPEPMPPPQQPIPVPVPAAPKYLWDTKANIRHSIRLICDELELTLIEKNIICAVIQAESGFNLKVERYNTDARKSIDYGLCQYNSYWYISGGLITKDQALNDPEFCVRLMTRRYRLGFLKDWVAYSTGLYKKYL